MENESAQSALAGSNTDFKGLCHSTKAFPCTPKESVKQVAHKRCGSRFMLITSICDTYNFLLKTQQLRPMDQGLFYIYTTN